MAGHWPLSGFRGLRAISGLEGPQCSEKQGMSEDRKGQSVLQAGELVGCWQTPGREHI